MYGIEASSWQFRAVTYNRCSTEEERQKDALVKQVQEAKNCVAEQGWQLIDTYVEAKSGTTSKGRKEYNRLYQELETDKFDIIVIKSQDRLMRNTKDWYLFLDRLQRNKKRLYIYLERKFYTPDDALITGIKAILAEEYSRELSKKINNAHRNRQREGQCFVITNHTYGYKKLPDKSLLVDEQEAEMIRMIFQLSANGYGTHCSAEILFAKGYRNREGNMLSPSIIRNIIRNPLYKGDVVQNRYHYDFDSKQVSRNPESDWIIHRKAIPAIVDDELFLRANRSMDDRREMRNCGGSYAKFSSQGKFDFSGKLCCGLCGHPFYRTVRQRKDGKAVEWKCSNYLQNGRKKEALQRNQIRKAPKEEYAGCDNVHVDEEKLQITLETICQKKYKSLNIRKEDLLRDTLAVLRKVFHNENAYGEKEKLEEASDRILRQEDILLEKLLDGVISDVEYTRKSEGFQKEMDKINFQLTKLQEQAEQSITLEKRIEDIRRNLESGIIEQAQTADMLQNIQKIKVFPDCLEIYLDSWKICGIEESQNDMFQSVREETDRLTVVKIPQKCSTSHQQMIEEEKKIIIRYMKQNPRITAKMISEKMDVSISLVNRRIRELRKEGKIHYSVPNGKGRWIIS